MDNLGAMPAALAGRGWKGSSATVLGLRDPGAQSSAGGADLGWELSVTPRLCSHAYSSPSPPLQGLRCKL